MYVSSNGFAMPVAKAEDKKTKTRVHCKRCPRCGENLKTVFVHDCCQGECA